MQGVKLVIFDWAGTAVDHGCFAPVAAFVRAFAAQGVAITTAEARAPMGLDKKDHIRALLRAPAIARRWREAHGRDWTEEAVEAIFRRFMPLQMEVLDDHSRLIPGLLTCVEELRRRGVRVGATTGYFREAAWRVQEAARSQGYVPEVSLCPADVPAGRPAPWMVFRIMQELDVYPPSAVVKVGDTVPDIGEGRNAGSWSVGVVATGSEVGCTVEEYAALPDALRAAKNAAALQKLLGAGAHYGIESVVELPGVLDQIAKRLGAGERP
jgi:phosphonoacetaldehyde hydrolase